MEQKPHSWTHGKAWLPSHSCPAKPEKWGLCNGSSTSVLSSSPPSLTFLMSLRMEVAKDDPVWAGLSFTQSRGMLRCADLHRRKVECLAHAYEAFLGASSGRQGSPNHGEPSLGPDVTVCAPFLLPFLFLCLSWALLSSWCLHFPETLHCPTLALHTFYQPFHSSLDTHCSCLLGHPAQSGPGPLQSSELLTPGTGLGWPLLHFSPNLCSLPYMVARAQP